MRWLRKKEEKKEPDGPVCQCSHGYCMHWPATRTCAEQCCQCKNYTGPEPVSVAWASPAEQEEARKTVTREKDD